MSVDEAVKIELPISATPEIMGLLIKAKHFFAHATLHAQTGNDFDTMISIHSLDNSIEYLLRIVIKHLEIEEKLSKTINTSELMALFGEVDKFLKEYTSFEGRGIGLPYENEIRQLRSLRNNVQHGMILPVNELKDFLKYGDKFFEKVLRKIFGLTVQEISYSTLIEDENIKQYLARAEEKIISGEYLEAIVACRDAFELGDFLLRNQANHASKMGAIPFIKQASMELYYYVQRLDEEISILGTNINVSDYRLYSRYIDHIPGEFRAEKSGFSVMQRPWEKRDADFCYSFVAQVILNWQLTQEKPLYQVDLSEYPVYNRDLSINGILVPELYPEKTCLYLLDNDGVGELLFIEKDVKEELQKISRGVVCELYYKITNAKTGAIFHEYKELAVFDAIEFKLALNNGPLWEMMIYYTVIPFTTIEGFDEQIDIDRMYEFEPKNENETFAKKLILEFGNINSIERARALNELLISNEVNSSFRTKLFSSSLVASLH